MYARSAGDQAPPITSRPAGFSARAPRRTVPLLRAVAVDADAVLARRLRAIEPRVREREELVRSAVGQIRHRSDADADGASDRLLGRHRDVELRDRAADPVR